VLVENVAAVEGQRQAHQLIRQETLPPPERFRVEVLLGQRDRLVEGDHPGQLGDRDEALKPTTRADKFPRGDRPWDRQSLTFGPFQVLPLLQSRRPGAVRQQNREQPAPSRKDKMPFQEDHKLPPVRGGQRPPGDRTPLLLEQPVGDFDRHDPIEPVRACELDPVRRLPDSAEPPGPPAPDGPELVARRGHSAPRKKASSRASSRRNRRGPGRRIRRSWAMSTTTAAPSAIPNGPPSADSSPSTHPASWS